VAPPTDLLTAQTQLATAQAQAYDAAAQRAQLEHALAVLVGIPPSLLTIEPTGRLPALPAVPELLPSTVLQRRPDIAAAERRVAAAYSQIGAADAAWFPSFVINAGGGFRQSAVAGLLGAPNLYWALGPTLAQAILDGGQRRLASDQARAGADEATAQYRQTVLTAFQEVEDNLVLADRLSSEAVAQRTAFDAAHKALEITREQYKAGTVSFLNVFVAQTVALSAERALVEVQSRQLAAVSVLLKNVGGRWEAAPTASAAALMQSTR
jgi:NodT family efflux transporter outer membrane factor (OMF) lipoprotein